MKKQIDNKGLVSVIMPVYNGYPLIKESIMSLLNQTYDNWECVIINDGSTDGTEDYLDSLTDERFVVHHFEKNKGRPDARQKGLELAKGEYIAMLDADDMYHPEKLAIQVEVIKNDPDLYLVGAGMCSYGENINFIRVRGKGDGKKHLAEGKVALTHAPSLLRRDHAIKFSYNNRLKLGEDLDFLCRYLQGKHYIILPDALYYYSEFDSVTKKKIRRSCQIHLREAYFNKQYGYSALCAIKYIILFTYHAFFTTTFILKQRGTKPTESELSDFRTYVKRR